MRTLRIRPFRAGEEHRLREVFYSSVHEVACSHYSKEKRDAWAPRAYDAEAWVERMRRNRPFVAELDDIIAGFADVQPDGHIDQFFVAKHAVRQGIGSALMRHLEQHAQTLNLTKLTSHVSLSAQPFFRHSGFLIEAEQTVTVRGVFLANARMFKILPTSQSSQAHDPGVAPG
ncbi:GNAT family N-acetyltransferase [Singulisphaera sp. GP187]|uniref:GNAT family N-acetyltransferase n=1 Tax=Singulisphaera sp. GP187 TaxID=1882752 RepID=UPI000940D94E|nr:GNAT family N-acetyltransferase [Singulisphaera sp. GP187]